MSEHPIEGLMNTAMNSIKDMIDVNTIIGEPIETSNNIVIIPISKVNFGFASGGSEFNSETINEYSKKEKEEEIAYKLPFGGGSAAGVSISPMAFLVITPNGVKLLPVNHSSALDKLMDYVPDLMEKMNGFVNKSMDQKKEEKEKKRKDEQKSENMYTQEKNTKEVKQDRPNDIYEERTTTTVENIPMEEYTQPRRPGPMKATPKVTRPEHIQMQNDYAAEEYDFEYEENDNNNG